MYVSANSIIIVRLFVTSHILFVMATHCVCLEDKTVISCWLNYRRLFLKRKQIQGVGNDPERRPHEDV